MPYFSSQNCSIYIRKITIRDISPHQHILNNNYLDSMSTKEDLNATIPMTFTVESDSESDSNTSEEGTYYG